MKIEKLKSRSIGKLCRRLFLGFTTLNTSAMLCACFITLQTFNSFAQCNDNSFNPSDIGFGYGDGANSIVETTSIQSDGKIIIGGWFTSYNGTASNYIARLNVDGTLDSSFKLL